MIMTTYRWWVVLRRSLNWSWSWRPMMYPGVFKLFGVFKFSSKPSSIARLSRFPDPEADVNDGCPMVSKLRLSWGSCANATCDSVSRLSMIILSFRSSVTVVIHKIKTKTIPLTRECVFNVTSSKPTKSWMNLVPDCLEIHSDFLSDLIGWQAAGMDIVLPNMDSEI